MKFVKGWYLPDSDTHFENYIENEHSFIDQLKNFFKRITK